MTKEKLERLQKQLSKELLEVCTSKVCLLREKKMSELNMQLDSLNRAAYYLMQPEGLKKS